MTTPAAIEPSSPPGEHGGVPRGASSPPLPTVTAFASLFSIAVGTLVLIGWTFDIYAFKAVADDITMKANAAVGLLSAGVALGLVAAASRAARRAGRLSAVLAGTIGFLTFLQHLTGLNFGIDELLFVEEVGATATTSPGRMGPNGSLSLTLLGIAILSLHRGTSSAVGRAQLLGAVTMIFAMAPLVGYLYGAQQLYAVARYTGIALHTAIALLVLSAGVLAARPDTGPIAALVGPGPVGVITRRLLVPALLLPTLVGYVRIMGQQEGLYDTGFGAAMFSVVVTLILCATIWRTAVALRSSDAARRDAEDALDETEARFRLLADEAPVLMWVEEHGARTWFNRRWFEFTGTTQADGWRDALHPDDRPGYLGATADAVRRREPYTHELRLRRADGTWAWVLESASPRHTRRGRFAGYVGSCIDISERKRAEQERDELLVRERNARDEAERASRLKDEFLATLSHELRTPLNAVLGWTNLLSRSVVADERRAHTQEVIGRNAQLLARLVEDLIDSSRIASGRIELALDDLDLNEIVAATVESLAPVAAAAGVTVSVALEPRAAAIHADRQRVQQVVWNLLSNAIKFNHPGGRVSLETRAEGDTLVLSVADTGQGIDSEFLPHLFERFRQGDSSTTRRHGGLGLGLSIARHLVELHGGSIDARSDGRGRGTTFTVRLPLRPTRPLASPATPARAALTRSAGD